MEQSQKVNITTKFAGELAISTAKYFNAVNSKYYSVHFEFQW